MRFNVIIQLTKTGILYYLYKLAVCTSQTFRPGCVRCVIVTYSCTEYYTAAAGRICLRLFVVFCVYIKMDRGKKI